MTTTQGDSPGAGITTPELLASSSGLSPLDQAASQLKYGMMIEQLV